MIGGPIENEPAPQRPTLLDAAGNGAARPCRPLLNCAYKQFRNPADLYAAYARVGNVSDLIPLTPSHPFCHWFGGLLVNTTSLIAARSTPTRVFAGENAHLALGVVMEGSLSQQAGKWSWQCRSGDVVLSPSVESTVDFSGARCMISLQPEAIDRAAAGMAGRSSGLTRRARQRFERVNPVILQAGQPQASAIHGLIRYIDSCFAVGAGVAMRLGLDDQIHRLAASLLQPELLSEEATDQGRLRESGGRDAFDELIDYIRANLDQPLRLSDLEARSHYSRRTLQYGFQERFGCSPKQWIREQRLALALEQLQAEGKRPSVKHVALACGYLNSSNFCSDFKRRYGITPAQASRL